MVIINPPGAHRLSLETCSSDLIPIWHTLTDVHTNSTIISPKYQYTSISLLINFLTQTGGWFHQNLYLHLKRQYELRWIDVWNILWAQLTHIHIHIPIHIPIHIHIHIRVTSFKTELVFCCREIFLKSV